MPRCSIVIIALTLLSGCTDVAVPLPKDAPEQEANCNVAFEPSATGTIRGRVVWDGDVPRGEVVTVRAIAFDPKFQERPARFVMPHHPKVDATSRGVENAVIFLRGVEPGRARPWILEPVCVEFQDRQLHVKQGKSRTAVGFVRRGAAIELVNRDAEYHMANGQGASLFSLPLLEKDRTSSKVLSQNGVIDLTCAAGYYWLHAHLFVAEHPYYVRADAEGRFQLDQVPAGKYEVVCWMPHWKFERHERDPETGMIVRLRWKAPLEKAQPVELNAGQVREVEYRLTAKLFDDK